MDIEKVQEFGSMVENLGNPNDILREKHTADLLRALQNNPVESMLYCMAILFSRPS